METTAQELIAILKYLLPGFLAAWIFYSFTSYEKPSQFERVVQALIFTLITQVGVIFVKNISLFIGNHINFGKWTTNSDLITSVILSTTLGFIFSYFANKDKFHKLIRDLGISKETSYPSEWYGEFSEKITFVCLHLTGERRIYGWPKEWPSNPQTGYFVLMYASWLTTDTAEGGKVSNVEIPLDAVDTVLIPAKDVELVEFMKTTESSNGQENIKS